VGLENSEWQKEETSKEFKKSTQLERSVYFESKAVIQDIFSKYILASTYFFNIHCIWSYQAHILNSTAAEICPEFFGYFGTFCFSCFVVLLKSAVLLRDEIL